MPTLSILTLIIFNKWYENRYIEDYFIKPSTRQIQQFAKLALQHDPSELAVNLIAANKETRSIRYFSADKQVIFERGPAILTQFNLEDSNTIGKPLIFRGNDSTVFVVQTSDTKQQSLSATDLLWVVIELHHENIRHLKGEHYVYLAITISTILFTLLLPAIYILPRYRTAMGSLKESIDGIASGRPISFTPVKGSPELEAISSAIWEMTKRINNSIHDLNSEVEDTTKNLKQTLETIEIQNIELELAKQQALSASNTKSEFIANTSHEIRTPLNSIIGFTEQLQKTALEPSQHDYLETISHSAQNLLDIINDVLDFSKIEAGKLVLDEFPFKVRETLESVMEIHSIEASRKKIELCLIIDSNIPKKLLGDSLRIRQIVSNLVNNAIKFSSSGQVLLELKIAKNETSSLTLNLSVSDQGIGISIPEQQKLFQAFSQAHTSTTQVYGGTGLGLIIVKKLAEQMSGDVGVTSRLDEGSKFWCTLKLKTYLPNKPANRPPPLHAVAIYDDKSIFCTSVKQTLLNICDVVKPIPDTKQLEALITQNSPDVSALIIPVSSSEQQSRISSLPFQNAKLPTVITGFELDNLIAYPNVEVISPPVIQKFIRQALVNLNVITRKAPNSYTSGILSPKFSKKIHVLAVDDNAANLKLIAILLDDINASVATATNGNEAIAICEQQCFDVILMDLRMPEVDGFQATEKIQKQSANNKETPIIALTAHLLRDEQEIWQAGFSDCLVKPIAVAQLYAVIKKVVFNEHEGSSLQTESSEHQTNPSLNPVNIEDCLKRSNYREDIAQEMLQQLINSLPQQQAEISKNIAAKNNLESLELVHKLHGACCFTGVPLFKSAISNLEKGLNSEIAWDKIDLLWTHAENASKQLQQWELEHDITLLFDTE